MRYVLTIGARTLRFVSPRAIRPEASKREESMFEAILRALLPALRTVVECLLRQWLRCR